MSKVQANEITYELHSLGWKAFQKLSATITAEIWGQTIQGFFDSHDGGRDGAFYGTWSNDKNETFDGSFTVQCKFTAKPDKTIRISDLKEELTKAKRLAKNGLADNYFLFTNAKLTGINDEVIRREFESISNINKCHIYGGERICEIIHESRRLRMLVPRIYGLGDLGQILDERAYAQSQEILSSLGNDLNKFIITDAYRKSVQALVEHGFVLLLGEPMCGKSTIAAALAMGALDEWKCSTIKIRDADDFVKHFNPHEKQLFWIDDAFGATQFDWHCTNGWNRSLGHINAAIRVDSKIIFTSRDYIYKMAKRYLKETALPVMLESQVVIQVEKLTKEEKEQILYNHIRLGEQPRGYKEKLKPFLPYIAEHARFSPEVARRFGNPFFTKNLDRTKYRINKFIDQPLEMLREVINTIDDGSRAALALVFLSGGNLPSPLRITENQKLTIERLGGSIGDVTKSLEALDESLLLKYKKDGEYSWCFKHPTVRDAFAKIVASSQDLMDIYLAGAQIEELFSEISCGDVRLQGVSVIVPKSQYHIIIEKLRAYDVQKWPNKLVLCQFLSYRCNRAFILSFLEAFPDFISGLSVSANSEVKLIVKFHAFGILPEDERERFVSEIKVLSVDTPDASFLEEDIKTLISEEEMTDILDYVKEYLIPNLDNTIDQWESNYEKSNDPESYFEELKNTLNEYKDVFSTDKYCCQGIEEAINNIDTIIENLNHEYNKDKDENVFNTTSLDNHEIVSTRSIFDDVDA